MNFKKISPSDIKSSKKFKYGASALVFSIVFVAFVILINVLISYIDSRNGGLYVDLTSKGIYEVTEASVKALDGIDAEVIIIFCQDEDRIEEDGNLVQTKMLAESYEKTFKNIKIDYKNAVRDKAYLGKFDKNVGYQSIIVSCPSTGLFKVFTWQNMYKFKEDGYAFAFDGEYKLTSAILSVARSKENMLSAGLVTGHGEDINHEVTHFLEDLGYAVTPVDLKTIKMDDLKNYDVVFVCNPKNDFIGLEKTVISEAPAETEAVTDEQTGENEAEGENEETGVETSVAQIQESGVNETGMLYDYVTDHFGNIVFFFDPLQKEMPELMELLADRFGVNWINYCSVWDDENAIYENSYNPEDWRFQGLYSTDSTTDGYKMHKSVSEADGYGGAAKPAFGESCLMQIPAPEHGDYFSVSPIVVASESAFALVPDMQTYEVKQMSAAGFPLMTLSKYTRNVGDDKKSGHVIVGGSMGFLDELDNPAYPNGDIMKQILLSGINDDSMLSGIDWKVLDEVEIRQTQAEVFSMMRRLGIIVPVIILIVGAVVFIKRKYF